MEKLTRVTLLLHEQLHVHADGVALTKKCAEDDETRDALNATHNGVILCLLNEELGRKYSQSTQKSNISLISFIVTCYSLYILFIAIFSSSSYYYYYYYYHRFEYGDYYQS